VQVADYLKADIQPAAEVFCSALRRGDRDAPTAWRLLKAEPDHIRDAVLAHHAVLCNPLPLATILPQLPKCLGARAVRSRFRPLGAASGTGTAYPAPGSEALQLAVDVSNATVVKELPALLPALTHLRGVTIAANADVPNPVNSVYASALPAAPGWAPLADSLLQNLPQLTSVDLRLPLVW
jgi:hypothetical protein